MNTIKKIPFLVLAIISLLIVNSCVQDDDFANPPVDCDGADANLTLSQLKEMIDQVTPETTVEGATEKIIKFTDNSIIEGYVVSSDSTGNFFKTVSIQDSKDNPTSGIQVEMDRTNLFNDYPIGSRIKIALNGLYAGYDRSLIKVGTIYDSGGEMRVGRMPATKILTNVAITCDPVIEVAPVTFPDIASAKASGIINTLIKIENVQFSQTGVTYANTINQETVNLDLEGATEETNDQTIILRTSGFADFADVIVPEGSGTITAVLSKYNSEWQLFIRDTNDVQFNNPRFGDGGGTGEGAGPVGGDSADYQACINEGFDDFDAGDYEFGAYINDAAVGTRYWEVKEFGGNKYIQMSSFNADDNSNVVYFIVPVDFSNADKFSFKTKDGYNNGNVLSVYYSTDYTLGGDVSAATLNDITANFTISSGNTSGYGADFVDSGEFNLSSISGNGAILFKYEGNQSVTTTMQIEDIMVIDNENPDCGGGGSTGGGIGGNGATFDSCLNESFSTAADNQTEFTKYENYALEGTRYWEARSFDGNKYIQFSSFNSGETNKTYFIVPVNFSEADSFSFKTNDGYNNGDPLKVYYSTNYTIGSDIANATLTDITSSFTISTGNVSGYGANFVESGNYDLSSLNGNGFIIFYYEGADGGVTTTIQIDDIKITDNENPDCDGGGPGPGEGGLAFAGSDFEDWDAFLAGINDFGLKDYATESAGNGVDGTTALSINMPGTGANDYVFTSLARPGLPATYSAIKFFVKGTSDKSISINLYKGDGSYYKFNLGDISGNTTIQQAGNNQYTGVINTGGQWAEITLDLSGITDLNTSNTSGDFFALKIGKEVPYDLYLDNFTIE